MLIINQGKMCQSSWHNRFEVLAICYFKWMHVWCT